MEFKRLDRTAPLTSQRSLGGHATIEEIRNIVIRGKQNFRVGIYKSKKRLCMYRSGVKIATIEVEDYSSDEKVIEETKKEILKGSFDHEIMTVYRSIVKPISKRLFVIDMAEIGKVHPNTIRRWADTGKIKNVKRDHNGFRIFQPGAIVEVRRLAGVEEII